VQATVDNMAHAHFMLDTKSYKHTLRIYNNSCFSTTTMVARTGLNVTLYVHWLSCWFLWLVYLGTRVYEPLLFLETCLLPFMCQYYIFAIDRYFLYEDASFYVP